MPNPWPDCPKLPRPAAAVLAALHLGEPRFDLLAALNEPECGEALDFADRGQLTLILSAAAGPAIPEPMRERLNRNAHHNAERLRRAQDWYRALAERFGAAGLEFLALKGLTQCHWTGIPPEARAQYDIDILTPPGTVAAVRTLLFDLGFEPIEDVARLPADHLPPMIRRTGWEWRGNFFDPEMPLAVEPHFRFWDPGTERLAAPGVGEFWTRRVTRMVSGTPLAVLHPADALAYSSLHLLKHLLRGSSRPFHVYELARFLDRRASDEVFWIEWCSLHAPELRRLEAVCFRLAAEWFGCRMGGVAKEEMDRLPAGARTWFEDFALEPAIGLFRPSKAELWLHIALLSKPGDVARVLRRRLLPGNLPGAVDAVHIPAIELTWRRRILKEARRAAFIASRLRHHTLALAPTAASGARWWWRTHRQSGGLGAQFWIFLAAAAAFNLGLFIFVLLYNLFLTDLGFKADFLGLVNGASRLGGVVGTIPAAFLAHRFGLRKCLIATIAATSAIEVGRALVGAQLPLAAMAFLSGCMFSLWAVILSPIIAGAVEEDHRPAAYSVFFACMFATGIAGNWLGGRLPLWMHGKRPVLLWSAAMAAVAVLPALQLRTATPTREPARVYPRSRFLWRFLLPFAVWHLATGSFNPFNNVYFARLGFSVPQIGSIFSGSQFVQVVAVLLAPRVIRRAGLLAGIVWMMAATAFALAGLATSAPGAAAILTYFAYMSFQWMSEPGLNSLLMNHIDERERSGASAAMFLVAFGAQALAAFLAGALLVKFDYGPVLAGAALLAGAAAALFGKLLRRI